MQLYGMLYIFNLFHICYCKMLTPSKKLMDSPLQTPSPARRHMKSPRKKNKENYGFAKRYHLIPEDDINKDFIWIKKEQKLNLKRKHKSDNINYESRRKMLLEEHRKELEGIKKRKIEHERLHEKRMREIEDVTKLTLAGEFENWEKEEHAFMLRQVKTRTKIRLQCRRPQPIDLLVQYRETVGRINSSDEVPSSIMTRLNVHELEDLLEDVKVYKEIEGQCIYWNDLEIVIEKYIKEGKIVRDRTQCRINSTVQSDISKIIIGKTSNQLLLLRSQIREKLKSDSNIDISFWESLLDSLKFHLSETRLQEMNRNSSPFSITAENGQISSNSNTVIIKELHPTQHNTNAQGVVNPVDSNPMLKFAPNFVSEPIIQNYIRRSIDVFEEDYSPEYIKESDLDEHVIIQDPEKDLEKLELARQHVRKLYYKKQEIEDDHFHEEGTNFTNEHTLPREALPLISGYTPRKPRYFNRLQTGFAWNRYNRTHYDIDNPPPKTVIGYRFNIYYPDLIDKGVTPTYEISSCAGSGDQGLLVLRFRAGPPYEDIAFKIVDKEWERSERRGYRCWFNGRVLELWFRFKRLCYRR